MEGGGGSIVTNNVASSAVVMAVLNGSEFAYDRGPPMPHRVGETMGYGASKNTTAATINTAASVIQDENTASAMVVLDNKRDALIASDQDEGATGGSSTAPCSSAVSSMTMEMNVPDTCQASTSAECATNINAEPGYPAIGSPPADLMVVNTNGFNPLQHAALRGNPG